jgi:long-chain acyl-CoA synthetase
MDTILDLIKDKALAIPEREIFIFKRNQRWIKKTLKDYQNETSALCAAFKNFNFNKNEKVAIISQNCYEWDLCEKALFANHAIVAGIDNTLKPQQIEKIISENKINKVCIYNRYELNTLPKSFLLNKNNYVFLLVDNYQNDNIFSVPVLIEKFKENKQLIHSVKPMDNAILIYTSGTTGQAKSIIFTHYQIIKAVNSISKRFCNISNLKKSICWLPLSNMTSRMMVIAHIKLDIQTFFLDDPKNIMQAIQEYNPNYILGVPRFFEKIHENIINKTYERPFGKLVELCLFSKTDYRFPLSKILNKTIAKKIKHEISGKEMEFFISGSAPLNENTLRFFKHLDLPIYEAYAMSEVSIPISMNSPSANKFGTVGKKMDGITVKIGENNEIMVKGDCVFDGYTNEQNLNTIQKDNLFTRNQYYKTGDTGYFTKDQFLVITGRLKDIIKTSTGIRVSSVEVESIYENSDFIRQIMVVGNNRKYITAIIVPNIKLFESYLNQEIKINTISNEIKNKIHKKLDQEIIKLSEQLTPQKQIKKYHIHYKGFTYETGELTKYLKLKRDFTEKKFRKELDQLYDNENYFHNRSHW